MSAILLYCSVNEDMKLSRVVEIPRVYVYEHFDLAFYRLCFEIFPGQVDLSINRPFRAIWSLFVALNAEHSNGDNWVQRGRTLGFSILL